MSPVSPRPDPRSGWPRHLPGSLVGDHDDASALPQVRRAIEIEWAQTQRALPIEIEQVSVFDAQSGLFRLDARVPRRHRLQHWAGATIWRDLTAAGPRWEVEVLESHRRGGWLLVSGDPLAPPEPGPAFARPFDFLRAPRTLLTHPRLSGALSHYGRLLGAARRDLVGPSGVRGQGPARPWDGSDAWTHGVCHVWGPPGTGKTFTTVENVGRLLSDPDERVLVVSTTNAATDELALRLGVHPAGVQRLGRVDVRRFREAGLMGLLPGPPEIWERMARAQTAVERAGSDREIAMARRALSELQRSVPRLRDVLADDHPRCVITTLHGALSAVVSDEMDLFHRDGRAPFTTVIVDEAGLVPRATAAAVGLLAARQLVLVGDPRQLSPICTAARSMEPAVVEWLALSAMEGLDGTEPSTQRLRAQRRMHPDIGDAVSAFHYDGQLTNHADVHGRPLPGGGGRSSGWPAAAWVVLDACDGENLETVASSRGRSRSRVRIAGTRVFGRLLQRHPELRRVQGLFISPFRAQADAAEDVLEAQTLTGTWTASTVHAQQGKQADVVVFDPVVIDAWGAVEWRRLINVAISRAKHRLVVVASREDLGQPLLADLADHLTECWVDAQGTLRRIEHNTEQQGLFASSPRDGGPASGSDSPTAGAPGAFTRAPLAGEGAPVPRRRASLGMQIHQHRLSRRTLTATQARLLRRDLSDLGPRIVRGVAGSGKTIVLAKWVASELRGHPDRSATVVFGNTALQPQLEALVAEAWRDGAGAGGRAFPSGRVRFLHMGTLLRDLRAGACLGPLDPSLQFKYDEQAKSLLDAGLAPRFGLLYIDEAQDLGHHAMKLLISLVVPASRGDGGHHRPVRIFYDNAQNIYGRSMPRWSEFDLDMRGRSTVFRESFRATRPAIEFALDVLDQLEPLEKRADFRELMEDAPSGPLLRRRPEGGWQADFCVAQGQDPIVRVCDDFEAELRELVRQVHAWLDSEVAPQDIRVLAPRLDLCERVQAALSAASIPTAYLRNRNFKNHTPRVVVTTPHSFKGYEAELVAVVGTHANHAGKGGTVLAQGLWVSLTRARTRLYVSASRTKAAAETSGVSGEVRATEARITNALQVASLRLSTG